MSHAPGTFSRPPLDGGLTLDQFYDWHRVRSSNFPAFVYPNEGEDQENATTNLTWKELGEGIARGSQIVQSHIQEREVGSHPVHQQEPIVIGILATSDIITYTTFLFSLIRLTHPVTSGRAVIPFPISTRNSPAAVAHLVRVTGVRYLFINEGPMRKIAKEALNEGCLSDTTILQIPSFSEFYPSPSADVSPPSPDDYDNDPIPLDLPALILHSSGSTAFPKPRTLTHRILLEWARQFEQGDLKVEGETMAVHASPVFHGMGVAITSWAAVAGFIRAAPSPHVALPPATPEGFLDQIVKSNSTLLITVPSFLETWSIAPKSVKTLAKLKAILWGGAPLKEDVGRFLHKEGVLIQNLFGATEFGIINVVPAKPYPEGYEWFKFAPHVSPELIREEDEEGVYELVFKDCDTHHLSALNTEVGGIPAYATSDLVERHPSNPELFKLLGRKDDQIMLSTGEKTNPRPLESIIVKNPRVKDAIMFGRGRPSNGILIAPESYEDVEKLGLEKFRNLVWPSIEEANEYAPAHSRIFKEMILIASPSKPFTYTVKRNARRGAILIDYTAEIDAIYTAVQDASHIDIPVPAGSNQGGGWTFEESFKYVREAVNKIMTDWKGIDDLDDLFSMGCDSLQATFIRNALLHALRQISPLANVQKVPSDFVYQNPTIRSLAAYAAGVSHTEAAVEIDTEAARVEQLDAIVTKYTQNWPTHRPSKDAGEATSEIILLTGSTGGLGTQLLAQLVEMPSVSRIYAFNRPARDGTPSRDRHLDAFLDRGNDVSLLDSPKIVFVEGDTAVHGFGINSELFEEIRDTITTIIHNAWRVDFNLALSSFEPAVRGVRYMIDLALQSPHPSPPRVMFASSIGIVKAWSDIPPIIEGPITDLTLVNNSGYSESKWVSERLLLAARQSTALRPIIIRLGQLCGGINGNWNVREWFPSLARASQVVGGAPENLGLVTFLPVHVAAAALIELRNTSNQFVHLVHPHPVPWASVIQHLADALNVPVLPYNEWLDRLEVLPTTDEAYHQNPALQLLGFYRESVMPNDSKGVEERGAMGLAMYETTRTVADAPSLSPQALPPLGKDDVNRWIEYWQNKGALAL